MDYVLIIILIILALIIIILLTLAANSTTTSNNFDIITQDIDEYVATLGGPGAIVNINQGNNTIYTYANGYNDINEKIKVSLDQKFRIGSVTKTFTGTIILMLIDQNKINLEDKLGRWYPGITNADLITVDDLLRMRSGMPDPYIEIETDYYNDPTLDNRTEDYYISLMYKIPAEEFKPPRSIVNYNNMNYALLGKIAEKVTGKSYRELIKDISDKLKLKATYVPNDYNISTHGYASYGLQSNSPLKDVTILNSFVVGGAGNMISTLDDLVIWTKALYNGYLISTNSRNIMLETFPLNNNSAARYGQGIININSLFVKNVPKLTQLWGHDGTILGFSTEAWYIPSSDTVIIISVNRLDASDVSCSKPILGISLNNLFGIDHADISI